MRKREWEKEGGERITFMGNKAVIGKGRRGRKGKKGYSKEKAERRKGKEKGERR
jgi:hypothetical protein